MRRVTRTRYQHMSNYHCCTLPHQVIAAATTVNATILGMDGKLGVIAPGTFSDLIAVNGNPLGNLGLLQAQGRHIDLIVKGGQILMTRL